MTGALVGFSIGVVLSLVLLGLAAIYLPEPATFDSDE